MEFTKEAFDFLLERNSILEQQHKSNTEFSSTNRLNESQRISQIGSWSWDLKSGKVEWSDMMYRLLGILPNQELPTYELALEHVHIDDKGAYEDSLVKAMTNKEDYYFENRIVKRDQTIINVISRGICICNEEDELIQMVGTVQDVTVLKQLVETNKQLEQFANILSHDFKTPIRTIVSFIGLIKKRSFHNLTEEGKEYFSFVEKGARHLSRLVTDILDYSALRSPTLKITTVSIGELLKDVLADLNALVVEKEATISIGWLPESIHVDRIKIRQVLQNLISNAIKFTDPEVSPIIEIYCEEVENDFIFNVVDNGIGIDKKHASEIFEPYKRTNEGTHFLGLGLGLSICKRIVQLHHGTIGYSLNKGGGSRFYFSIPR